MTPITHAELTQPRPLSNEELIGAINAIARAGGASTAEGIHYIDVTSLNDILDIDSTQTAVEKRFRDVGWTSAYFEIDRYTIGTLHLCLYM